MRPERCRTKKQPAQSGERSSIMKTKSLIIAAMAAAFAVTAAAPSFAAPDPVKKEKRITRMIKRLDLNGDSRISQTEMSQALAKTFAAVDANRDGGLSANELANAKSSMKQMRKQAKANGHGRLHFAKLPMKKLNKRFEKLDANADGKLSQNELSRIASRMFKRGDRNKDGYISVADLGR